MNDFMQGFIQAAKETPRKYFTPLTAIWFSVKRPGGGISGICVRCTGSRSGTKKFSAGHLRYGVALSCGHV